MNLIKKTIKNWKEDNVLLNVIKNSGYLIFSNVFAIFQSILTGRMLGIMGFGIIGTITSFASTLNRLFSFRMNELVVKYYGEALASNNPKKAGAVVKASLVAESITALISFIVCALAAPFAAERLADNAALAPEFILYGTIILANIFTETSSGILQVNGRFRIQALINLVSSIFIAGIIFWAYSTSGGLLEIVFAYMAGKFVIGIGTAVVGLKEINKTLGKGWFKSSYSLLPPLKELAQFAFSTNISSTIIMLVRDNEVLWIAYFLSPLEAGYAKAALALINLVQMPITPFISTSYPEINRAVAKKSWKRVKQLLRRITFISGGWTVVTSIGLAILGKWLLSIYGTEFQPAYTPMMIFLIGLGFANVFFWNRPLLLSLGLPLIPFRISLYSGIAKILLSVLLVPFLGLNFEALLLSGFFVISIILIIRRGLKTVSENEKIILTEQKN